jgi:nitroreductase
VDAMDAILSRRSIRKYTSQPVPDAFVTELLRAAMAAPSAANQQPWQFVVITDRAALDKIPTYHPYAGSCRGAPLAILVCLDQQLENIEGMGMQDVSAATQNILVAARALGLGGVWLGVHPRAERQVAFRRELGLPEHVLPFSLISLGYPAEEKPRADRYDASRVHLNRW